MNHEFGKGSAMATLVSRKNENGSVLIPLALLMMVLLAIVFTAIDVGHYYLARAKLQSATDAVLINAMRLVSKDPTAAQYESSPGVRPNEQNIRLVSQQVGIDNLFPSLAELSIDPWAPGTYPIEITKVEYNPLRIEVVGHLSVNTWLVKFLPGFQSVFVASSSAEDEMEFKSVGERPPLVLAILLDRSRSMLDPINGSRCTDCTVAFEQSNLTSETWYAQVLESIDSSLISRANAIVRDDLPPPPPTPVPAPNPSPQPSQTPSPLPSGTPAPTPVPCGDLPPAGSQCTTPTKFSHAKRVVLDLLEAVGSEQDKLIVKAFSDGVSHIDTQSEGDLSEIRRRIGQLEADGGTNMEAALQSAYDEFKKAVAADVELADARFLVVVVTDGNPVSGKNAPCPSDGSTAYKYDVAPWMIKAIEIGDKLRVDQLATIYTLGIGTEAAPSAKDPYQDRYNATKLKPYFLRRLANDQSFITQDPPFSPQGCPDAYQFYSYEDLDRQGAPVGRYFKIDGSNINTVVQAIGEDNLMKVVE